MGQPWAPQNPQQKYPAEPENRVEQPGQTRRSEDCGVQPIEDTDRCRYERKARHTFVAEINPVAFDESYPVIEIASAGGQLTDRGVIVASADQFHWPEALAQPQQRYVTAAQRTGPVVD